MKNFDLMMQMARETTKAVNTINNETKRLENRVVERRKEKLTNMVSVIKKYAVISKEAECHPIIEIPIKQKRIGIQYDYELNKVYFYNNDTYGMMFEIPCENDFNKVIKSTRRNDIFFNILDNWDGRVYEKKFTKKMISYFTTKLETANEKHIQALNTARLLKIS